MSWPSANDPFYRSNIAENNAKRSYYAINAVPHYIMDGDNPANSYPYYQTEIEAEYQAHVVVPSILTIDITGTIDPTVGLGTVTVTLTAEGPLGADSRLNVGVMESNVYANGTGSYDWHHYAMRDLLTGGYGETLDPFLGPYPETRDLSYDYYLDPNWLPDGYPNWEECDVVAWVQEYATRDVYQSSGIADISEDFEQVTIDVPGAAVALEPGIGPNRPNPFNPRTLIPIRMTAAGEVEVGIYTTDGRLVRALAHETMPEGETTFEWDGLDDGGQAVSSGVYFVRMTAGGFTDHRAITLLK